MSKALLLAFVLMSLAVALHVFGRPTRFPQDFGAFYCAGSVVAAHRDPYLSEPLRSCEAAVMQQSGLTLLPYVTLPAPLPGYTLTAFMLFASAPFLAASAAFSWILMVALGSAAVLLRKMSGITLPAIVAALTLSGGWVSLSDGQLAPIVLLFLCLSAFALERKQMVAASLGAAGAMLEPHIALPVCICLAVVLPRTRLSLGALTISLSALSIVRLGWHTNVEYFTRVLPEHALAESTAIGQFSLTTLLTHFGTQPSTAVVAGNGSYFAMTVLGCLTAQRLYIRSRSSTFLVVLPPAFVLLGGPFVHLSQMVIAVPALLLLWRHFPEQRCPLGAGLIIIAVPWQSLFEAGVGFAATASVAVTCTLAFLLFERKRSAGVVMISGVALIGIEAMTRFAVPRTYVNASASMAGVAGNGAFADATWSVYEHLTQSSSTPWYLASHLPTWSGLSILIVTAIVAARQGHSPLDGS